MKTLVLCGTLLISLVIGGTWACQSKPTYDNKVTRKIKTGSVDISTIRNTIILSLSKTDGAVIQNVLHTSIPGPIPNNMTIVEDCEKLTVCVFSDSVLHTKVEANPNSEIIKVSRVVKHTSGSITDCYELAENTEWFGGPQYRYQHWPIQHIYFEEEPYVPTHEKNIALAERYWLSSKGIYILVAETAPLFLDQNNYKDKHLCLVAKNKEPYRERENITLDYEIGVFPNPRLAHENVIKNHFGIPTGSPDFLMVKNPIWSTWARYKDNINETIVNTFADEIVSMGFNNSQLEIDDNWETCYGSAVFDTAKFPDITRLSGELKNKGYRVTLWIHPFINEGCSLGVGSDDKPENSYEYAKQNGYFVKNLQNEVHTQWWQGAQGAGLIDFTNPDAVAWWVGRLKKLQKSGIDSFKFDAGEISWAPQVPVLNGTLDLQPGIFTKSYVTALAENFDNIIEARVGWGSQKLPIFIRMIDKDSKWTWNNGLPTLITTLLQMNLNGYVYVLPDMIGGNGYVAGASISETELPPKELFIRWLQANVFMPSLQFSFVPWQFDDETVEISRNFTNLHSEVAAPIIMKLMNNTMKNGAPINPPIWWIDPGNNDAHKIKDEYLLGEEILVAPVIEEDAITRDVYLPSGKWKDANTNKVYAGPMWLRNYPAPLNVLPYFYKE